MARRDGSQAQLIACPHSDRLEAATALRSLSGARPIAYAAATSS
jgi:hypothetical protein